MTKINCKLLTSSTTVITGAPGNYTVKTVSHTIDPTIKKTINCEVTYSDIDNLAKDFGLLVAKTIARHFREKHAFNITIKDFEIPEVQ